MPERIFGATVSADLFPLLGVQPIRGRTFRPEECATGRDDVLVISERLWRRKFDRDPRVLGSKLIADGRAFTVVGIMPASFEFPLPLFNITGAQFGEQADIWQPIAFTEKEMKTRGSRSYGVIGRLAPGVSRNRRRRKWKPSLGECATQFPDNYPQTDSFGATLYPLKEQVIGGMKPLLLIFFGAVALVLLIACANLATMLLARAIGARARDGDSGRGRRESRAALAAGPDGKRCPRASAARAVECCSRSGRIDLVKSSAPKPSRA